jgi:2-hydroxychromene-2-carboxylate isomerase
VSDERSAVNLWFDPACPWAWLTSRWLLQVAEVRPIDVTFNIMSLYLLNQGKEVPERYRELIETTRAGVRVVAAVEAKFGKEALANIYTELGTRYHNNSSERDRPVIEEALAAAGLPTDLAAAADSDEYDEAIKASHTAGITLVGEEVGTPVIQVEGIAYFGPVLSRLPSPEKSGEIWDAARTLAAYPYFWEIKRTRTQGPEFDKLG